jgi:hypothetical protein
MSSDSESDWDEPSRVARMVPVAPVAPALTLGPAAQTRLLEMVGVAPDVTASSSALTRYVYHQIGVIGHTTEFGINKNIGLFIDQVYHGGFKSKGLEAAMAARDRIIAGNPAKQREVVQTRIQRAIQHHGKLADVIAWCKKFDPETFVSVSMDDEGKPNTTERDVCWNGQSKQWYVTVEVGGTRTQDLFYAWEFGVAVAKRDEYVAAKCAHLKEKHHDTLSSRAFVGVPWWYGYVKDMPFLKKFWVCFRNSNGTPSLVVRSGAKAMAACHHPGCVQLAISRGGDTTLCIAHGGGQRCIGTTQWGACPTNGSVQTRGPTHARYGLRCVPCFCIENPNDAVAANAARFMHFKEQTVMAFVRKAFPDHNWAFDKGYGTKLRAVGTRRTRLRPDARTSQGDRVLILEVDEKSHRHELCASERDKEESSVVQAGRGKTVLFIRFNPDEYTDYAGKKHPSCFTHSKTGCCSLNPKYEAEWIERLEILAQTIDYLLNADELPPKQEDRAGLVVELFYAAVADTSEDVRVRRATQARSAMGAAKRASYRAAAKAARANAEAVVAAAAKRKREEEVCEGSASNELR